MNACDNFVSVVHHKDNKTEKERGKEKESERRDRNKEKYQFYD